MQLVAELEEFSEQQKKPLRLKRSFIHFYEVSRGVKFIETGKNRGCQGGGRGKRELLHGYRVWVLQNEKVWRLDAQQCEYI